MSSLFSLCAQQVDCVLLNACYAEVQADAIVESIDYMIGMRQAVPDEVAIAFPTGFYRGLGSGKSVEASFTSGCDAIKTHCEAIKAKKETDKKIRKAIFFNESGVPAQQPLRYEDIPVVKTKISG